MFAVWEIDWKWVAGIVVAGAVAWVTRVQSDLNELKAQVAKLKKRDKLFEEPYPSEGSEEEAEVKVARELSRRKGIKLSFAEAAMVVQRVRADKERKKAAMKGEE